MPHSMRYTSPVFIDDFDACSDRSSPATDIVEINDDVLCDSVFRIVKINNDDVLTKKT